MIIIFFVLLNFQGKSIKYSYPDWAIGLGSLVLFICVMLIPLGAINEFVKQRKKSFFALIQK